MKQKCKQQQQQQQKKQRHEGTRRTKAIVEG